MKTEKLVFKGKRRKIHIHQRAFKVFVGDPFVQYWCIDFGLLTKDVIFESILGYFGVGLLIAEKIVVH